MNVLRLMFHKILVVKKIFKSFFLNFDVIEFEFAQFDSDEMIIIKKYFLTL